MAGRRRLLPSTAPLWLGAALVLLQPAAAALAATPLHFNAAPPPFERGLFLVVRADQAPPAPPRESGSAPALPAAPEPRSGGDWEALARDTGYLIGYQALAFGILYVSPESVSNWSVEQKHNYDFSKWTRNVTHPHFDTDAFWINYLAHPYCGMAYYLDARGRGFGRWGSFAFSFFASGLYEFGTEAFAEKPSIQDIFVTPIGGALLGIAVEGLWGDLVAKGGSRNWAESTLLLLIDPLGQTNHAVDRLFGIQDKPYVAGILPVVGPAHGGGIYTGIELSMRF
jgi:hypothetical protein